MNGLQSSKASFLAGIPVASSDELNLENCMRAAERKGLKPEQLACSLADLPETNSAIILLLKGGEYPVAVLDLFSSGKKIHNKKLDNQKEYSLSFFSNGHNEKRTLSEDELSTLYSGEAIIFSRSHSLFNTSKNSPGKGFSSWLVSEVFAMRGVYRDVLLASIFLNLFVVASPLFVMNVYDRVVPNSAVETLWVLASGVVLVFVFDLVIKLLRHYFIELAGQRLDVSLSSRLFERVLNLRQDVFPESVGLLASKLRDFDFIKQFFTAATLTAVVDLPFSILFLLLIFYVGGAVSLAPMIAGLILLLYGWAIHFPLKSIVEKSQQAAAQKNAVLIETLSGIETLKAFNAEGRQQGFWEECLFYLAKTGVSSRRLADSIAIVSGFIIQFTVVAVVVIGAYKIAEHQMSMGALIACVLLSSRALAPIAQLASLAAQYYQAKSALVALDELTELPVERSSESTYLNRTQLSGEIDIENLSFTYDQKLMILKDLNIKVRAGEKIALIGKIGSGKSTLMRLLLGLGKASSGQIKIDHIGIDQLDPAELRADIAYVPQDVTLFRGTLKDNILLKSPLSDNEALLAAADIAGLNAFVNTHAKGFDMPIGEQGKGLSGGQRQSVAIARAVIGEPNILLFDELTSAMDNQTESAVIEKIRQFSKDKTMILSTHRASLLALVDRIIVMDEGRVIADGTKDKVLDALKRGLIQAGSNEASGVGR